MRIEKGSTGQRQRVSQSLPLNTVNRSHMNGNRLFAFILIHNKLTTFSMCPPADTAGSCTIGVSTIPTPKKSKFPRPNPVRHGPVILNYFSFNPTHTHIYIYIYIYYFISIFHSIFFYLFLNKIT